MINSLLFPAQHARSTRARFLQLKVVWRATAQNGGSQSPEIVALSLNFGPFFWQKRPFVIFFPRELYFTRTGVLTLGACGFSGTTRSKRRPLSCFTQLFFQRS